MKPFKNPTSATVVGTLPCALEADLYVKTSVRRYDTIAVGLLKKEEEEKLEEEEERRRMPNRNFFTSRGACVNCSIIAMLYTHSIGNQP